MILVRMACGHPSLNLDPAKDAAPRCPVCGDDRVARVQAMAPKFRGIVRGPSASYQALDGVPIAAAPDGPLPLKGLPS